MTMLVETSENLNHGQLAPDSEVMNVLMASRKKSIVFRLTCVVLMIAVGIVAALFLAKRFRSAPVQYQLQQAKVDDLEIFVTATGTLDPTNVVEIGSEISGRVERVAVDTNDSVEKGDLLIELDTEEIAAQVEKSRANLVLAQADLLHAEATLSESRIQLERMRKLSRLKAISQSEYDSAKATLERSSSKVDSCKARVDVAQATLDGDESKLSKTRIYSPINGIVLRRNAEPGQTLAAAFQTPILLTLCNDLREMELKVGIDEADVGRVAVGQDATFTVDAWPDVLFPATISSIHFASERKNDVVTYEATLKVRNESLKLRPGMTAVANIVESELKKATLVSNSALRFTPSDETSIPNNDRVSTPCVWVLENGRPVHVPVQTGLSDGRWTELISGDISPGDAIIEDEILEQ
ncbi:MAG: efflux RND transporter periplasmic adaptor subunit [Planctomycetota bacterium]